MSNTAQVKKQASPATQQKSHAVVDQTYSEIAKFLHSYDQQIMKGNNKLKFTKKGEITFRQTNDSLNMLKEVLPNNNLESVLKMLYKTIVKRDQNGNKRSTEEIEKISQIEADRNIGRRTSFHLMIGKVEEGALFNFDPKDPAAKKIFENPEEQLKFQQKRMVAQTLIKRQYGISAFSEELASKNLNIDIDKNKYKTVAYSVVTETYRKIQHFLIYMCNRKIKPVNHEQLRCIFTVLLNFRKYFKEKEIQAFMDFLNMTYSISEVTLSEVASCHLYLAIQQMLKQRITTKYSYPIFNQKQQMLKPYLFKNRESNAIFNLQRMWNNRYEEEMIQFFKNDQQFANMREYFKQIYPDKAENFTINSLKSQFFKMMRVTLRQLATFLQKYGPKNFPQLIKLDDKRIKFIIRSPGGDYLRLKLIDIYNKADIQQKYLAKLVRMINQFVISRQKGEIDTPLLFEQQALIDAQKSVRAINTITEKGTNKGSYQRTKKDQIGDELDQEIIEQLGEDFTFDDYLLATGDGEQLEQGLLDIDELNWG